MPPISSTRVRSSSVRDSRASGDTALIPSHAWTWPSLPDVIPVLGGVAAGVAEDAAAGAHALLELDGEADEGGDGELEFDEAFVSEGDVYRALRLALVPELAGGDDGEEAIDEGGAGLCVGEVEEAVARVGHVVAAQDEALDVGWVELTHCGPLS